MNDKEGINVWTTCRTTNSTADLWNPSHSSDNAESLTARPPGNSFHYLFYSSIYWNVIYLFKNLSFYFAFLDFIFLAIHFYCTLQAHELLGKMSSQQRVQETILRLRLANYSL